MTIDPQIVVPFAIAALFLLAGVAATVTTLAVERAKRAEARNTQLEALLDKHGITREERP